MKDEPSPGELWWLFISQTAGLVGYSIKQLIYLSEDARAKSLDYEARQRLSKLIPTDELHTKATEIIRAANFPSVDDFTSAIYKQFITRKRIPSFWISNAFFNIAIKLYGREKLTEQPLHKVVTGEIERGRYNDHLIQLVQKAIDPEKTLSVITSTIFDCIDQFISVLPPVAFDENWKKRPEEDTLHISLIDVIPDVPLAITALTSPFEASDDIEALNLFESLRKALLENRKEISDTRVIQPADHRGSSHELVKAYLKNTILEPMFDVQIPFSIPDERRLEHTAIVAGSGWGKTQLLQSIIANDIEKDDPPSLIVLDSTGQMVDRIQRLAVFNDRLKDRLLIIDPAHSPALNMFDLSTARFKNYTPEQKEDVQSEVIKLFNYIFSSEDYDLTSPMGTAFAYAVRLILARPGSTIIDLRKLLESNPKSYQQSEFKDSIETLDPDTIEFFKHHFFSPSLSATRASVARRIHNLIAIPAFRRMFTASTNTLDLFNDMQNGTICLVNTNENLLKEDGCILFGRYVIARALGAAFERAAIPAQKRKPTFLIIDEASPYFDENFEKLLTRVRQFKLGVTIAFQHLEQAPEKLRSAIASNTSVKYAGGLGYGDSRWLGREMRCTPEYLLSMKKDVHEPPQWTEYACYIRNMESAVRLRLPFYAIENMPTMTEEEHEAILKRNLERVAPIVQPALVEPQQQAASVPLRTPVKTEPAVQPVTPAKPSVPPMKPTTVTIEKPSDDPDAWGKTW